MRLHTLAELDSSEGTVKLHNSRVPSSQNDSGLERSNPEDDAKQIILHPQPNPLDPNDPLRWPRWKKHTTFTAVCIFTFLTNFAIGGLAPAFATISQEFGKTQDQTSNLLLWPILVFGVFNFLWVPIANYVGKRPVFVFCNLLLAVAYLWGALAGSFESLLWSGIVGAFAGSSTEAVGTAVVNDLYFLHERGTLMSFYINSIAGGNTIGPLICGFVVQGLGWRYHKWIAFALTTANWILVLFFCPETRYERNHDLSTGFSTPTSTPSLDTTTPDDEAAEKPKPPHEYALTSHPPTIPRQTYLQSLTLWTGTPAHTNLFKLFLRPLPLMLYPAVTFAFLGYAVALSWVGGINILSSFVLSAPPYDFAPAIIGLFNIPGLLGNVFGAFAGGWAVDRYCDWRSRRSGGVFRPETRLHFLLVPGLLVPVGCLVFGYGVAGGWHWVALFWGYGFVAVGLTAVPVITMSYVSDCYLPVNADALLLVNGLKNIVGFGVLKPVVPWVTDAGYVDAFGTQAGVFAAIVCLGVPLILYGAKLRHITAQWRIIL